MFVFIPNYLFFFFTDTATTEIYTLSLHDALPISPVSTSSRSRASIPAPIPRSSRTRPADRKSTRLNSSHVEISYAVFCLKKKKKLRQLRELQDETRGFVGFVAVQYQPEKKDITVR